MDLKNTEPKMVGCKKKALESKRFIDSIYDHGFSKIITKGEVLEPSSFCILIKKYVSAGLDMNSQDTRTGESFFHVLSRSIQLYTDATTVYIVYMMATQVDTDIQDNLGDTVLHKVCLIPGTWRCIVALMRNNACPLIKNNMGFTPEDLIIRYKNPEWEENLYWLRKFSPGLMAAVNEESPSMPLIERLLKSWCRTSKVTIDNVSATSNICFKARCPEFRLDLVCIFEKYTNTNEFVLSLLCGKLHVINVMMSSDESRHVDLNTRDHSYQYHYKHYPVAPRPLLATLWETEKIDIIKSYLSLGPDLSVKYSFEAEESSPPKPLFFLLVNPKSKPQNEETVALILGEADLSAREQNGQTILFEAIFKDATLSVIKIILNSGVNIAARDKFGRTARDHCILLNRFDYRDLIDNFVGSLDVKNLESLVLQAYDGIPADQTKLNCAFDVSEEMHPSMSCLHANVQYVQDKLQNLFALVKAGDFSSFTKLVSPNLINAQDKAGRTFLHYAVQQSGLHDNTKNDDCSINTNGNKNSNRHYNTDMKQERSFKDTKSSCVEESEIVFSSDESDQGYLGIISFLVENYCSIAGFKNNLGQTAQHYAYIYCASQEVFTVLEKAGDYSKDEDVFGYVPQDYNPQLCGEQTSRDRRKTTVEMDLNIFLIESQFDTHMQDAVQTGELSKVVDLLDPLLAYGGEPYFSHVLFDCLDSNKTQLACYLALKGFNTNISKQYDKCNPDDAMCAMMECSHSVTTLRQRAVQVCATDLLNLIDNSKIDVKM